MSEKRNEFSRDPETHQLVLCKDNQLALHHDGVDVDYMIELDAESEPGKVTVHYAFDPEVTLTDAQKDMIVEDTRKMVGEMFSETFGGDE